MSSSSVIEKQCGIVYRQVSRAYYERTESITAELLLKDLNSLKLEEFKPSPSVHIGEYETFVKKINRDHFQVCIEKGDFNYPFITVRGNTISTCFPVSYRSALKITEHCISDLVKERQSQP
jgi:hypothetical protein